MNLTYQNHHEPWEPAQCIEVKRVLGLPGYISSNKFMSLRFEMLLKMWHFFNNEKYVEGDRPQPFLDNLTNKYQEIYTPGRIIYIANYLWKTYHEAVYSTKGSKLFNKDF